MTTSSTLAELATTHPAASRVFQRFIVNRYHTALREELPALIALAAKVEAVCCSAARCATPEGCNGRRRRAAKNPRPV